jgi:hypothetical protein
MSDWPSGGTLTDQVNWLIAHSTPRDPNAAAISLRAGETAMPSRPRRVSNRGRGKSTKSMELIGAAHTILSEIQPASVRAVCYRLFTLGLLPNMGKGSTDRVSTQLTWAREQSLIPWEWIADDTRKIDRRASWDSPAGVLEDAALSYRRDWWEQQPCRVLLCSEKSTVSGTVKPVTDSFGVGFLSLHGYSSATRARDVAALSVEDERPLILLYIGDWDPSGMDMSERDLPGRIEKYGGLARVERIALTADDVVDPALPSFDAESKSKDARYPWFTATYGRRCWELDALSPVTLRERVDQRIRSFINWDEWERCTRVEDAERESLAAFIGAWKGARAS